MAQFNAHATASRQSYVRMDRGDMFIPAQARGLDTPRFILTAQAASPFMGRVMPVHSVPVTYIAPGRVNMTAQATFKTPVFGVRA